MADLIERQQRINQYTADGILTSALMMDAALASTAYETRDYSCLKPEYARLYAENESTLAKVWEQYTEIEAFASVWEARNWLYRLQNYYAYNDYRGHSAGTPTYTARLWGCAGRVLLTLESGDVQVTLIFDESSKHCRGGIQSVSGTFAQIIALLASALFDFPTMTPDKNVSI